MVILARSDGSMRCHWHDDRIDHLPVLIGSRVPVVGIGRFVL